MKRWIFAIGWAVAGAVIASLIWSKQLLDLQIEFAATTVTSLHGQAGAGERMLSYLDDPQPEKAKRVAFMASNMVSSFSVGLDWAQKRWPYVPVGYGRERERLEQFLRERQKRFGAGSGEPDRAANPSQPVRSETNSTSQAAGLGR